MRIECAPGSHTITFAYKEEGNVIASKSLVVTVISGRETTISGKIDKNETSTGISAPTSETKPVEVKQNEATTVSVNVAPATTSTPGTKITFEAGSFTEDSSNAVLNLSVKSAGSEFSVTSSDTSVPVAGIDISLKVNEQEVTSFNNEYVVITTYILAGLESVQVKYNGTDGDQPIATDADVPDKTDAAILSESSPATALGYNKETGLLRFKTNHFSEYYVLSDCVAVNITTNVGYSKFANAVSRADDNQEIKIINDVNLSESIDFKKDITLDLNGKTITGDLSAVDGKNPIFDIDSSSVEIKDSVGSGKIISNEYGIRASNGGTITLTSGSIKASNAALAGNNITGDMNFIINGGTLTSEKCEAIYMPGQQTLTINGGTINGGISSRMGQITITGGTINGMTVDQKADSFDRFWNYSGSAWIGDAIYVWGGTYNSDNETYGNSCNINITGGTINGNAHNAIAVYDIANNHDQEITVKISDDAVINGRIVEDPTNKQQNGKTVSITWNLNEYKYGIVVKDYGQLSELISDFASNEDDDIIIYCKEGTYKFDTYISTVLSDKNLSIIGIKDKTVFEGFPIDANASGQWGLGLLFNLQGSSSISIEGITFKDFARYYDTNGNKIVGDKDNYGQGVYVSGNSENTVSTLIKDCSFSGLGGRGFVSIGAGNITIDGCEFNASDRHYSTINVIEIFGGKKVEVKNSIFDTVSHMNDDWPSTAIAIFDTTGKWESDSSILIDSCTFKNCEDYCINHELCFNNRAPIPVVKNTTYENCDNVIAHIYTSYVDKGFPNLDVNSIFTTAYSNNKYLSYVYLYTNNEGIKQEDHYYSTEHSINSDYVIDNLIISNDFDITVKSEKTLTVSNNLSILSGKLIGEEGSKLIIGSDCTITSGTTSLVAGTSYTWKNGAWEVSAETN